MTIGLHESRAEPQAICPVQDCAKAGKLADRRWPAWARIGFLLVSGIAAWSVLIVAALLV